jgi:hypothetical protein
MIDLLITTFQLMLNGKLFRDPAWVLMGVALCNAAVAVTVIVATGVRAARNPRTNRHRTARGEPMKTTARRPSRPVPQELAP